MSDDSKLSIDYFFTVKSLRLSPNWQPKIFNDIFKDHLKSENSSHLTLNQNHKSVIEKYTPSSKKLFVNMIIILFYLIIFLRFLPSYLIEPIKAIINDYSILEPNYQIIIIIIIIVTTLACLLLIWFFSTETWDAKQKYEFYRNLIFSISIPIMIFIIGILIFSREAPDLLELLLFENILNYFNFIFELELEKNFPVTSLFLTNFILSILIILPVLFSYDNVLNNRKVQIKKMSYLLKKEVVIEKTIKKEDIWDRISGRFFNFFKIYIPQSYENKIINIPINCNALFLWKGLYPRVYFYFFTGFLFILVPLILYVLLIEIVILVINDLLIFLIIGSIFSLISLFILFLTFLIGTIIIGLPLHSYRKLKSHLIETIEDWIIMMDKENLGESPRDESVLYGRIVLNDLLEKNRRLPPLPVIYLPALGILFPSIIQFLLILLNFF
ncbi:MAG: hypothetical protein ACW967_00475 [Candidatus Hodarchaeales archaeon]|jgi:hypothetical protein